jgi:tol-pal system protein YbgF
MRFGRLLLCALLGISAACGTTQPDELEPELPPRPAAAPVDPRVSDLQVTVNELLDRIEVLQSRVVELERREPAQPVARTTSSPSPSTTAPAVASRPPAPQPDASARPASRAAQPETRLQSGQIADRYREALTLFGKGALDQARAAFQQIFDSDPAGELADNSLYWIGETYFTTGKYGEAIRIFERIEADYADQNKAPDAIYKIGAALAKQGDLTLAKRTYERLIVELNRIRY